MWEDGRSEGHVGLYQAVHIDSCIEDFSVFAGIA